MPRGREGVELRCGKAVPSVPTMSNTMSYRGYSASMTFDPEDKILVGRVLDVDDIISFHGESVAEFESNFHATVDGYISACEQLGCTPEKPASGKPGGAVRAG